MNTEIREAMDRAKARVMAWALGDQDVTWQMAVAMVVGQYDHSFHEMECGGREVKSGQDHLSTTQYQIVQQIADAIIALGGRSDLLGIICSWGDTLPEDEILDQLRTWNATRKQSTEGETGVRGNLNEFTLDKTLYHLRFEDSEDSVRVIIEPNDRLAIDIPLAARIVAAFAPQPEAAEDWMPHKPTPRQQLFLDLSDKEAFYGGAAAGGKSDALLMAALQYVDRPGYAALLLRRTYADLSKPGALMDRSHSWGFRDKGARWNEQKKQWKFPSGAILQFGYLDTDNDVYQYQSSEFQFVGFDELTQFTERQYTYLFSRLRRLSNVDIPLRMRSASNPGGIGANWVEPRFIPKDWIGEMARELKVWDLDGGRKFVPARIDDNPHVDQASYRESLAELDEVTKAQLEEGNWSIRPRGNIYKSWSDGPNGHHVITWTQFETVFNSRQIPRHWRGAVGQDWGFDPDPCATVWNWMAAENGPLAGSVFVDKILTCRGEIPDSVGEKIKLAEDGQESQIDKRVMSHEASSQRETYRIKCKLNFHKWKPDSHGGVAQMQHYLNVHDKDAPHPFKPWLNGRPRYYVVVPDDQISNPKEDEGLALLRAEFAAYKYVEQRVTDGRGANKIVPYDYFNHFMDAQRGIAAEWFAPITALTPREKENRALPPGLQVESAPAYGDARRDGWEIMRDWKLGQIREKEADRNPSHDDPWKPVSPFKDVADGFWSE